MAKKEVTQQLADKALDYLNGLENFVAEQAPDYIKEVYDWAKLSNWIGLGVSSVIAITLASISNSFYNDFLVGAEALSNYTGNGYRDAFDFTPWGDGTLFFGLMSAVTAFLTSTIASTYISELFKLKVAPKVWLVDYFRKGAK